MVVLLEVTSTMGDFFDEDFKRAVIYDVGRDQNFVRPSAEEREGESQCVASPIHSCHPVQAMPKYVCFHCLHGLLRNSFPLYLCLYIISGSWLRCCLKFHVATDRHPATNTQQGTLAAAANHKTNN